MFDHMLLMLGKAMLAGETLAGDAWHVIEKLLTEGRHATGEEAETINAGVLAAHAKLPEGHPFKLTPPQMQLSAPEAFSDPHPEPPPPPPPEPTLVAAQPAPAVA
jgi:hypothetical protein